MFVFSNFKTMGILQIFTLLGALGMFLYGMNLMSSGLQKAAGDRLRGLLSAMTSNPFRGEKYEKGFIGIICWTSVNRLWGTGNNGNGIRYLRSAGFRHDAQSAAIAAG